jgi:hypothetical protein
MQGIKFNSIIDLAWTTFEKAKELCWGLWVTGREIVAKAILPM